MLESLLDEIPTLGEARRKAILEIFGSVAALRKASVEQIATVPGIGEKIAAQIHQALNNKEISEVVINTQTGEITTPH